MIRSTSTSIVEDEEDSASESSYASIGRGVDIRIQIIAETIAHTIGVNEKISILIASYAVRERSSLGGRIFGSTTEGTGKSEN